jgi:amino acid transporter
MAVLNTPPNPQTQSPVEPPTLPPAHKYDSAFGRLRHVLFGRALTTSQGGHMKLPIFLALPIFSSDALSSNAYATEAILGVLVLGTGAGVGALHFVVPIAIGICLLLATVVASYRQIIFAYPDGGGAYPVSRDNLGALPSLVAAASLLVDYILTVATSVAAGAAALITADPRLGPYLVPMCYAGILFITLLNLRGVREAGWTFAGPAYLFIGSILATLAAGLIGQWTHAPHIMAAMRQGGVFHQASVSVKIVGAGSVAAGLYLVLQAFSQGCTALTGVEAISNTTPLFKAPHAKNAANTTVIMGILSITMFFGLSYLAVHFGIHDHLDQNSPNYQSVVGQIAAIAWPGPWRFMFWVVQISTALILVIAANAAFAGFPQLASMLARDNYLPRQLANIGDRLSYSNGILLLAVAAGALIYIFKGIVDDLLSLYAIGVFTSFTIAQFGMVRRWLRTRERGWQTSLFFNALGAIATGAVTLIIGASKFDDGKVIPSLHFGHFHAHYGAWIVILIVPIMVSLFLKVHQHYDDLNQELSLDQSAPPQPTTNVVLVLVPRLHRGIIEALEYARLVGEDVRGICIETNPEGTPSLKRDWEEHVKDIPLVIMESPYRSLLGPLLRYIDAVQRERSDDVVTIIVPELVSRKWWHRLLHNQAGPLIRFALAARRDVVVTNVRFFLER